MQYFLLHVNTAYVALNHHERLLWTVRRILLSSCFFFKLDICIITVHSEIFTRIQNDALWDFCCPCNMNLEWMNPEWGSHRQVSRVEEGWENTTDEAHTPASILKCAYVMRSLSSLSTCIRNMWKNKHPPLRAYCRLLFARQQLFRTPCRVIFLKLYFLCICVNSFIMSICGHLMSIMSMCQSQQRWPCSRLDSTYM